MKTFLRIFLIAATALATGSITVMAQDAAEFYSGKCASCHGPDGAGKHAKGKKLKVKDVRVTLTKMSVAEMATIVERGKGVDMDAFGTQFNKTQIAVLLSTIAVWRRRAGRRTFCSWPDRRGVRGGAVDGFAGAIRSFKGGKGPGFGVGGSACSCWWTRICRAHGAGAIQRVLSFLPCHDGLR